MKMPNHFKSISTISLGLIFFSLLMGQSVNAEQESRTVIPASRGLIERDAQALDSHNPDIWVVRVDFSSRQEVAEIAAWIEPWEVHYEQGYLLVGVLTS